MTAEELRQLINDHGNRYGLEKPFPSPFYVNAETYGNVCDYIFKSMIEDRKLFTEWDVNELGKKPRSEFAVVLVLGPNCGILFKGIELIIN